MAIVERAPDAELLLRLRNRDREAWEQLYAEFQPRLRKFAFRLSGNVHDADDLVQETFVRAVPRLDRLDPATVDLGAYLFTTCKHLFYKQVEKSKRAEPVAEVPEPIVPSAIEDDPERSALLRSQQNDVRVANAKLDSRQRLVLALRELEEKSYAEIGEIVGLRENAVAQLIFRARESLRTEVRLAQVDPDSFPEACRRFLPLLARHLDGELEGPKLEATLAHLDGCERCQSALADMREASKRYRSLFLPAFLDADECKAAIDRRLDEAGYWVRRGGSWWRLAGRRRLLAGGVAALVVAIGGLVTGLAVAGEDPPGRTIAAPPPLPPSVQPPPPPPAPPPSVTEPPPPLPPPPPPSAPETGTELETTQAETETQADTEMQADTETAAAPQPEPKPKTKPKPKPQPVAPPPAPKPTPPPPPPADTTAPVVTITAKPDANTTTAKATISFSANEPGATFLCSLDGADGSACASPVTLDAVTPGEHRFSVLARDKAGNSSGWTTVTWRYQEPDTKAPTVTITSSPPASATSTSASFSFISDEQGVSFACSLDGAAFAACASPASYVRLAYGQHTFSVKGTDAAGNTGQPATFSWTISQPLPDLAVTAFGQNSITITNRGTAAAGTNTLTITLVGTFTVPSLQAGASVTLTWSICRNGTYTAIVDRSNVVAESDEKNNTATRSNQCPIG